ncbi:MAG: hypothetical protein GF364_09960, partial [Candidatus Lokiarchaeota archaeon]|nr:hypothetical protein [Candidatus Lokiarchaeota archaeon]
MAFKIVYIGAGSFRFSIVLFMDICRAVELSPLEVWLVDIDKDSLDIMTRAFKKMTKKAKRRNGIEIKVYSTTDRKEALENADFVYKSISVGIQAAEWFDIYVPYKLGIPQNTGDTVGPGGLFRGLRTNRVCAEIAKDMKKLCPKAPLLSYTNPQSSIVMAARTAAPDIQFIGLCHELFGGMGTLKKFFKKYANIKVKNWEEFDIEYSGVNHFTWLTKIGLNGKDLYPIIKKNAHKMVLKKFKHRGFNFYLCEKYGYFSIPGSRHVAEFLPDYYNYFNHEIQCPYWSFPTIRNVKQLDTMRYWAYKAYKLAAKGWIVPKPRNSGERAIDMTIDWHESLSGKNTIQHVVNIPNNGTVPELPEDCIVEVPATFKNGIITPAKTIHLPKTVADLVRPHAEQHRMTVNAALGNDLDLVVKAMLHDPMANWIEDDDRLEYLTKLMLFYEQKWLPEEWQEWIPS